jgi:hypothetical protein
LKNIREFYYFHPKPHPDFIFCQYYVNKFSIILANHVAFISFIYI